MSAPAAVTVPGALGGSWVSRCSLCGWSMLRAGTGARSRAVADRLDHELDHAEAAPSEPAAAVQPAPVAFSSQAGLATFRRPG